MRKIEERTCDFENEVILRKKEKKFLYLRNVSVIRHRNSGDKDI